MTASRVQRRATDVIDWCSANRLQLNAEKTQLLWFGPASQLRQLSPDSLAITVIQNVIKSSTVDRDVDVSFDNELSMLQRVSCISQTCFIHLRRLRSALFVVNLAVTLSPDYLQLSSRLLQRTSRWFAGVDTSAVSETCTRQCELSLT